MKQSNRIIAAALLFTAVATGTINAQQSTINTSADAAFVKNNLPSSTDMVTSSVPAANPKIEARFAALFPNASDLHWVAGADNYWVKFLNNGRTANACFTAKGKMNYAITECGMMDMPEAFSKAIQKEYPAYSLLRAIEIKAHDAVAYQAILEDANGYVTLKYTTDGVEKIQQVVKQ